MQTLEVFEGTIEEWILVVPLDFHGDDTRVISLDVVHLVRRRFARRSVDRLRDLEYVLAPAFRGKRAAQALCELCLASAAADDLADRQIQIAQCAAEYVP